MDRRCAWCGRSLDGATIEQAPGAEVRHGICSGCHGRLRTGTGVPVTEFIDSMSEPVLLMDADHTVGIINRATLDLLHKETDEVLGEQTGAVFECENAHLPGGCPETIHCSGCTIRHAVAHTHLTGEPRLNVPATLRVVRNADLTDVDLVISTARVGDRVLLKIDRHPGLDS